MIRSTYEFAIENLLEKTKKTIELVKAQIEKEKANDYQLGLRHGFLFAYVELKEELENLLEVAE